MAHEAAIQTVCKACQQATAQHVTWGLHVYSGRFSIWLTLIAGSNYKHTGTNNEWYQSLYQRYYDPIVWTCFITWFVDTLYQHLLLFILFFVNFDDISSYSTIALECDTNDILG